MHTIKPIDREAILFAAEQTGKILTVEEHNINGGLGNTVAQFICQNCFLEGMTKTTYGIGSSIVMNIGKKALASKMGLLLRFLGNEWNCGICI